MQIYIYLIFDVDDTLLDFYPAYATAQRNIAEKLGIKPSKEYLLETYGKICDVQELVNCYLKSISSSKVMKEPDTLSIYVKLSKRYKLVLATNGIEWVQKERVSDFLPYTHKLYISEEIGYIKPTGDFYNYVMEDLKCKSEDCLMIGDSITNDIIGAKAIGMDVCYYRPKDKRKSEKVLVDYEVTSIRDLVPILL